MVKVESLKNEYDEYEYEIINWEDNEKRCPMYLTQILNVDANWLGEEWETGEEEGRIIIIIIYKANFLS